jgi:hypothetical protein
VFAPFVAGWKVDRRTITAVVVSVLVFFAIALGIFAIWFATHAEYRANWHVWLESGRRESARHPIGLANLKPFAIYFLLAAPLVAVALPFAFVREFRQRGWSLLLLAAATGLLADALLFLNYSTTINWRYFLTGLPALVPLTADYFLRSQSEKLRSERRGFITAVGGVLLIAIAMGILFQPRSNEYLNRLALAKDYNQRLALMPPDAVVIAGAQTVAVTYWRGIGAGQWEHIVDAGFPAGLLQKKIEEYLSHAGACFSIRAGGNRVRGNRPRLRTGAIEPHFHFRQVAPTVFEIRPLADSAANDHANLQNLLPENRPEEVKKCFGTG